MRFIVKCASAVCLLFTLSIGDVHSSESVISAVEGEQVRLPCSTGRITSVTWEYIPPVGTGYNYICIDGKVVPTFSSRFTLSSASFGDYSLVISSVTVGDAGQYVCKEDSGLSRRAHTVQLEVQSPPVKSVTTETDSGTSTSIRSAGLPDVAESNSERAGYFEHSEFKFSAVSVVITAACCFTFGFLIGGLCLLLWQKIKRRRRQSNGDESVPLNQIQEPGDRVCHTITVFGVVLGITQMGNELFVLHHGNEFHIDVFDIDGNYDVPSRQLKVPGLIFHCNDMTSCGFNKCLYIADPVSQCIHKMQLPVRVANDNNNSSSDVSYDVSKWFIPDHKPHGLSVTHDHYVLVTCDHLGELRLYDTRGTLQQTIVIKSPNITNPFHAIELSNGQFVLCHAHRRRDSTTTNRENENNENQRHGICIVDVHGTVVTSYDATQATPLNTPRHLAVDEDRSIFVANCFNNKILLLNSDLTIKQIFAESYFVFPNPYRLHLDSTNKKLYVAYYSNQNVQVLNCERDTVAGNT